MLPDNGPRSLLDHLAAGLDQASSQIERPLEPADLVRELWRRIRAQIVLSFDRVQAFDRQGGHRVRSGGHLRTLSQFADVDLDVETVRRSDTGVLRRPNTAFEEDVGKGMPATSVSRWREELQEDEIVLLDWGSFYGSSARFVFRQVVSRSNRRVSMNRPVRQTA